MESPNATNDESFYRVAVRRTARFFADFGGIPLIGLFVAITFILMVWAISAVWSNTSQWFASIGDPTERGMAYVAAAIVFHAIFGKSDVDVKVDGKRP
jgi:succinate dehydrogenase/fumarate reductase cytochrome b subunit